MSHRNRGERGQTVVEFVLMLPFILLLIMALAEFGFAFYSYVTINNATSEASRYAAIATNPPSDTCEEGSIQARAIGMSNNLLACGDITVQYNDTQNPPRQRTAVTVNVSREYTAITPLPGLISLVSGGAFPSQWDMTACSDARLENDGIEGGDYNINGTSDCGGS